MFYSQYAQDIVIAGLFENKIDGVYVDVGAYDGVKNSNTKYFDEIGWRGLCIEANPEAFKRLKQNRSVRTTCINALVSFEQKQLHRFYLNKKNDQMNGIPETMNGHVVDEIVPDAEYLMLEGITLNSILNKAVKDYKLFSNTIDYLSIDTEGHEHIALQSIDFSKWDIKAISFECNSYMNVCKDILSKNGYRLLIAAGQDEIYIKQTYLYNKNLDSIKLNYTIDDKNNITGFKVVNYFLNHKED